MAKATPWDRKRIALQKTLRALREDAGLKQSELAERMGKHQSFVSKYENGERRLDLIELEQIAEAIGRDLTLLVKRYQLNSRED